MRIAHITSEKEYRGGERQVYYLIRELKNYGIEQGLFSSSIELIKKVEKLGVDTFYFELKKELSPSLLKLYKIVESFSPDILHFHNSKAISLVFLTKIPAISTRRVMYPLKSFFSKFKYKKLKKVVAVSENVKNLLKKYGITRIEVVYDGIENTNYILKKSKNKLKTKFSMSSDFNFSNVGFFEPAKGHKYLLEAVKILKTRGYTNFSLHIAGKGKLENELKQFVKKEKLDNVFFHGYVDEVREFVYASDCFVVSSISEGLNSTLIDAFSMGIPSIGTNAGGIPEVISNYGIIVEKGNSNALADAMVKIIENYEYYKNLTEKGRKLINDKFSIKNMTSQYLKIYNSIINS